MIDLTPLDVRNKRGDFRKKTMGGYDTQEVDVFLELAAERMEELVRENIQLRERTEALQQQVASWSGREKAVQEALVTAQELRSEMKTQAQRQAEFLVTEAQAEARRQLAEAEAEVRMRFRDAERKLDQAQEALEEMERRRHRFLKSFRQLLEREMDVVVVEEGRAPLEERAIELDLGGGRGAPVPDALPEAEVEPPPPPDAPVEDLAGRYRSQGHDLFSSSQDTQKDAKDPRWG
ncbi:MAG: DivIVA domain-containing protein [Gemmatimonadetes bacterium]|nr:DivIVA domain-containing protein [Gemmatimonadota bacterium]